MLYRRSSDSLQSCFCDHWLLTSVYTDTCQSGFAWMLSIVACDGWSCSQDWVYFADQGFQCSVFLPLSYHKGPSFHLVSSHQLNPLHIALSFLALLRFNQLVLIHQWLALARTWTYPPQVLLYLVLYLEVTHHHWCQQLTDLTPWRCLRSKQLYTCAMRRNVRKPYHRRRELSICHRCRLPILPECRLTTKLCAYSYLIWT